MGQEWSPANEKSKTTSKTWIYNLDFGDSNHFVASEEQLSGWNGI